MKEMTGWTLSEMAQELGVPQRTIERRVQRAGIKPLTREALYPPETLGIIETRDKVGRPPKAKKE
jgi:predicted DNA-binding transcriptional regulator YafY